MIALTSIPVAHYMNMGIKGLVTYYGEGKGGGLQNGRAGGGGLQNGRGGGHMKFYPYKKGGGGGKSFSHEGGGGCVHKSVGIAVMQ